MIFQIEDNVGEGAELRKAHSMSEILDFYGKQHRKKKRKNMANDRRWMKTKI